MSAYIYYMKRRTKHYKNRHPRFLFYFKRHHIQSNTWEQFTTSPPDFNFVDKTIKWFPAGGLQKNQKRYKVVKPTSYKCPKCAQIGCTECRRNPFALFYTIKRMTSDG